MNVDSCYFSGKLKTLLRKKIKDVCVLQMGHHDQEALREILYKSQVLRPGAPSCHTAVIQPSWRSAEYLCAPVRK